MYFTRGISEDESGHVSDPSPITPTGMLSVRRPAGQVVSPNASSPAETPAQRLERDKEERKDHLANLAALLIGTAVAFWAEGR